MHFCNIRKRPHELHLFRELYSCIREYGRNVGIYGANKVQKYERILSTAERHVDAVFAFVFHELADDIKCVFYLKFVWLLLQSPQLGGWFAFQLGDDFGVGHFTCPPKG